MWLQKTHTRLSIGWSRLSHSMSSIWKEQRRGHFKPQQGVRGRPRKSRMPTYIVVHLFIDSLLIVVQRTCKVCAASEANREGALTKNFRGENPTDNGSFPAIAEPLLVRQDKHYATEGGTGAFRRAYGRGTSKEHRLLYELPSTTVPAHIDGKPSSDAEDQEENAADSEWHDVKERQRVWTETFRLAGLNGLQVGHTPGVESSTAKEGHLTSQAVNVGTGRSILYQSSGARQSHSSQQETHTTVCSNETAISQSPPSYEEVLCILHNERQLPPPQTYALLWDPTTLPDPNTDIRWWQRPSKLFPRKIWTLGGLLLLTAVLATIVIVCLHKNLENLFKVFPRKSAFSRSTASP